jgi:DNA-binding NtrC family response regulator
VSSLTILSNTTLEYVRQRERDDETRYALVVLLGEADGDRRRFELATDPMRIGREVANHVRLSDPLVSRQHAEIHWSEIHRRHWIRDLGSRNGVHVNGTKLARGLLTAGDILRIGDAIMRFTALESGVPCEPPVEPLVVGTSRSLCNSFATAARVANSNVPVLILGPTGTGKELVAKTVHRVSGRTGPLVAVNCATLPTNLVESELFGYERGAFSGAESARPGLFRAAHSGTLFLDEVGELPLEMQAKLLRAIDARAIRPVGGLTETSVDVRVVAATNRDLFNETRSGGGFRSDLYARLVESVVELAPLRDRPEDLMPLWRHFVSALGQSVPIEPDANAFEAMALYAWPFNVRELRQLVRSALLRKPHGGKLAVAELPAKMRPARQDAAPEQAPSAPPPVLLLAPGEVPSKSQLRRLVEEFRGNVKNIANFLSRDRKQIYRWLERNQIDPDVYRQGVP